ncbi:MAG TPA: single-stranded DNA-binding protein [Blastocatellia bacterium]|jgi:single-strand DNA-binding protein|nr:single-stranded DNA-binding protein [Blastocatellia bacterium]
MASFNKVILVGYLGRDPELRYTPEGTAVCNFSMATTERKKSKSGEFHDVTTWFRVTLWRRQAEVASQYLSKGRQVYVEGRLSMTEYQDRDGNTRTSLEVQGTDIQFIGSRGDEGSPREPRAEASASASAAAPGPEAAVTEDDIPF